MRLKKTNSIKSITEQSIITQAKSSPNLFQLKKNKSGFIPDLSVENFMETPKSKIIFSNIISLKQRSHAKLNYKTSPIEKEHNLLMKKLENWDKEHISMAKENPESIYNRLSNLYKEVNLKKEKRKLEQLNSLLKSKSNLNKIMEKGRNTNKIMQEFFNKRNKDQGSILRNNIIKTKTRFNFSLFLPKQQKEIEQNIGINNETIQAMNAGEINNEYFSKVMKDKIKYENQLHEELISVNKDIYEKKCEKKERNAKLSEIYNQQSKLTKKFNILFNKRKSALEKFEEQLEIQQKRKKEIRINKKNTNFNNFLKNIKVSKKNNEISKNLLKERESYIENMNKIKEEKEKCIKDIKRIEEEILYYKQVNEELLKEQRQYYMEILKNGFDSRREGMIWCVRNLLELQTNLEYHHFPKFLSHEEIDFLIQIAKISLEEIQLKIILKALRKKQSELKEKENIRRMSQVDDFISKKYDNQINNNNIFKYKKNLTDYELEKIRINKKFFRLYTRNDDTIKMFGDKSLEDNKDEELINKLKQNLFGKGNFGNEEGELLKIFQGDEKHQRVLSLILFIRKRMDDLNLHKKEIIQEQIKIFKERLNDDESNLNVNQLMEKELIKKCLFGSSSNI